MIGQGKEMNAIQIEQPAAGLRNLEDEWQRLAD